MKLAPILTAAVTILVTQIGYTSASFNARQVSLTSPDTPELTPTPSVSSSVTSTDSLTSTGSTSSAPTISSSPFASVSSVGTDTLSGIKTSVTIGGSQIESLTTSSPNGAATPVHFGAGVLAGLVGAAVAL
ncbi:hypothetical protein F4811DRAFT_308540 [Daldinia bambusicola]|nr:hypothetical protein F4811DRAFT_308540 [Daldinia bambusicola]